MTKRKKSIKVGRARQPRRSPYQRSLDYATKRLEKAVAEQRSCELRLAALNQEIPYLRTVIRALTPAAAPSVPLKADPFAPKGFSLVTAPNVPVVTLHTESNIQPPLNVDEEDFLPETIPGKEVLP